MGRLRPQFPWFRLAPLPSSGVAGAGSSTDNAIVRWDGAGGGTLQNSGVIIDDNNNITGVLSLTATGAGNKLSLTNTTDANAVQVAIFEGDRATMADNDEAYVTLRLSNDGGTQTEVARITWAIPDVNAGTSVDGRLDFAVMTAGTLADELQLSGADLSPSSDDGLALGTINLQYSDLFLASGGVITFANDMTITHAADLLTFAGGVVALGSAPTMTSPAVTTSLTTPSTTFALVNTTATTINFAGAATTLNVGASATCILNFGGSTTASEFRFLEPSGSGTNYSGFKAVAQAASIDYSLPPSVGAAGTVLTDAAGNGVLTWAAASGGLTKIWIPAHAIYVVSGGTDGANFGDFRNIRLADAAKTEVGINGFFPSAPTAVKLVFIPSATGNMAWFTTTDFGAVTESYTTNSDAEGSDGTPQTTAVVASTLIAIDVIGSFTGAAAGDYFGLRFTRDGDDAADTIENAMDLVGVVIEF